MAGDSYAVDPTLLSAASRTLAGEQAALTDLLARCQRSVDGLRGTWRGQAHAHFEGLYVEWQRGAQAVVHALAGIATMTGRAAAIYAAGDDDVGTLMRGL